MKENCVIKKSMNVKIIPVGTMAPVPTKWEGIHVNVRRAGLVLTALRMLTSVWRVTKLYATMASVSINQGPSSVTANQDIRGNCVIKSLTNAYRGRAKMMELVSMK
jgi:hypothetical protein